MLLAFFFFFQAEDGIRDYKVTGVQTCALPISGGLRDPVSWRHVPEPLGSSSQNWPALRSRKLPVTGSSTSMPFWMPTCVLPGVFGIAVAVPFESRRHSLVLATLPPP